MKTKKYFAAAAFAVTLVASAFSAQAQATKSPCPGCPGGTVGCCRATNGSLYLMS